MRSERKDEKVVIQWLLGIKLKVLITDSLSKDGTELLKKEADVDVATDLSEKELVMRIKDYDALIVRSGTQVTRDVINAGRRLKVIGRAGVGVDNIDVGAATERGIIVLNAPEGNTVSAAEHAIAMMMSLSKNIPPADESVKRGEWTRSKFVGVEVRNKVLGIIGLGRVGAEVAKIAHGLGMHILAYDPFISVERAEELGVRLAKIDDVVSKADFITIHAPLTKESHHSIGKKEFERMKGGVRIINCARGGIIDEKALYGAIKSGKVAGAALDVFEQEPPVDSPLLELDSVIMTPHLGASTREAQINVAVSVAEGVIDALKEKPVRNAVNMPAIKPDVLALIKPYLTLAEKLGRLSVQLIDGRINTVEAMYSGEVAERDTGPLTTTILKGILDPILSEPVNFVNAPVIAKNRGIKVIERKVGASEDFTGLITVVVRTADDEKGVAGTLFGKNDARIVRIDNYHIDALPSGYMLISKHIDKPGIIGHVGMILGKNNINIAGMQVGRESIGGEAVMVLNIDGPVSDGILKQIEAVDGIQNIKLVVL
ncbi:MAG: phosphoglycerate dehydrogenase [Methanosarcinales archaeon Met12]|nr:MAG: phosphoglycerate dehydrogenase [Methanosarcinales archaeon Met12]